MTKAKTIEVQRACNHFTKTYLKKVTGLRVDGDYGPATVKRVRVCKYYCGYKTPNSGRPSSITETFFKRLRHPNNTDINGVAATKRGKARRKVQHTHALHPHPKGVSTFDGIPVATVAVPILRWCREHGWKGKLNSGWRDPEYSEHLCIIMCGHPTCPGTCAGKTSNHVGVTRDRFAVDVTFYTDFARIVAHCPRSPRIFNDLPRDRVHFSPTGH